MLVALVCIVCLQSPADSPLVRLPPDRRIRGGSQAGGADALELRELGWGLEDIKDLYFYEHDMQYIKICYMM
jgi:hypothetical protein